MPSVDLLSQLLHLRMRRHVHLPLTSPPQPPVPSSSPTRNSPISLSLSPPARRDRFLPMATGNSSSPSMYPPIDSHLSSSSDDDDPKKSKCSPPVEETLITVPGAILHLIDKHRSVKLACGDLSVLRLRQGDTAVVAVLARVAGSVQWPLSKDQPAVRLDGSHYFFSLRVPPSSCDGDSKEDVLNYGLTVASKGQEGLLRELDGVLEQYTSFSMQKVAVAEGEEAGEVLGGAVARGTAPGEVVAEKEEEMERESTAYWTALAPNVEDYSGCVARAIAIGSGHLIKGIFWCGDVAVDRLKWGHDLLKKRMGPAASPSEITPQAMQRIQRVKRVTKMSENVVTGILSGVVKVSGYFTSSVVNSKAGKKFFGLIPGEIVLASLDGFSKICDAAEVVGKNVLSTSSTVTTGLVSHRYGEQAAEYTNESLDAAGHAMGTAWAVFKIRKALDPKSSIKPTVLAKSAAKAAAAELKGKFK